MRAGWEEDGAGGEPCEAMLTDKGRRRIALWILRDVQGLFTRRGPGFTGMVIDIFVLGPLAHTHVRGNAGDCCV